MDLLSSPVQCVAVPVLVVSQRGKWGNKVPARNEILCLASCARAAGRKQNYGMTTSVVSFLGFLVGCCSEPDSLNLRHTSFLFMSCLSERSLSRICLLCL